MGGVRLALQVLSFVRCCQVVSGGQQVSSSVRLTAGCVRWVGGVR